MNGSHGRPESDVVAEFKKRLLPQIQEQLEGTIDVNSNDDFYRFDGLLNDLLKKEAIVLSRTERQRLRDELLSSL